jgi:phosphoribosyl-AMP cyclohydrolase
VKVLSETISKSIDEFINSLKYDGSGLIPAVVQDALTKEVLMVAYMNPESLKSTITSGKATYFSRSRQKLWVKGETSGHFQHVRRILFDCDRDTLLIEVEQEGVACHTGYYSCFFREAKLGADGRIEEVYCLELENAQKPE